MQTTGVFLIIAAIGLAGVFLFDMTVNQGPNRREGRRRTLDDLPEEVRARVVLGTENEDAVPSIPISPLPGEDDLLTDKEWELVEFGEDFGIARPLVRRCVFPAPETVGKAQNVG